MSTDHPNKPELSSTELLRQAREAFAPPKLDTTVDTSVDGPSLQDLLSTPLSSESLLPQRAVDHWAGAASAEARREALAALKLDAAVEGPTIEELLSAPLSSESLLPQRAVDHWVDTVPSSQQSSSTTDPKAGGVVREPLHVGAPTEWVQPPGAGQPPAMPRVPNPMAPPAPMPQPPPPSVGSYESSERFELRPGDVTTPAAPPPPWLEPFRGELGLPPAPARSAALPANAPLPLGPPVRAPRPLGPPIQPVRAGKMPWRLIVAAIVGVSVLVGAFTDGDTGTPSVTQLAVGDCFETPRNGDFTRVANQDCAGAHEAQIYAQVSVDRDKQFSAGDECSAELIAVLASVRGNDSIVLPADTVIRQISDVQVSGIGSAYCTIESPSGSLVGSLLPE